MQRIFCTIVKTALNVKSFLKYLISFSWQLLWYQVVETSVCLEIFMWMMRPVFFFVRLKSTSRSSPPLSRCQSEYTMNIFDCNTAFDVVASRSALIIFDVKWHNYWGSIAKLSAVIGGYLQAEKCAEQRTTDLFLNGFLVSRSNRDLHLIITIFACQF